MIKHGFGRKYGISTRNKVVIAFALLVIWLIPSYLLFTGSLELNPRGNVEVSLLIGWALAFTIIDLTSLILLQFEELWRRLRSLL